MFLLQLRRVSCRNLDFGEAVKPSQQKVLMWPHVLQPEQIKLRRSLFVTLCTCQSLKSQHCVNTLTCSQTCESWLQQWLNSLFLWHYVHHTKSNHKTTGCFLLRFEEFPFNPPESTFTSLVFWQLWREKEKQTCVLLSSRDSKVSCWATCDKRNMKEMKWQEEQRPAALITRSTKRMWFQFFSSTQHQLLCGYKLCQEEPEISGGTLNLWHTYSFILTAGGSRRQQEAAGGSWRQQEVVDWGDLLLQCVVKLSLTSLHTSTCGLKTRCCCSQTEVWRNRSQALEL